MFINYFLKSSLLHSSSSDEKHIGQKPKSFGFSWLVLMLLFAVTGIQAQTTIINPATDGGFNQGSTFAANGWTVANEGVSPVKWAVGTAASGTTSVGSTTNASATVTLSTANGSIAVGQIVYGSGIPANTYVSSISGTTLTMSQNATASASGVTLGFGMFPGGISVGTTQTTNTSIAVNTYSVTLSAANPNISVGMAIAPIAGFIGPDTYVASINGTALGLSKASLNGSILAVAQTMVFSATSSAITGNAAYVSNDNGLTNSYAGYPTNRTVYFYKDITTIPSNEKAMTLTFDVKCPPSFGGGWQVWVAPISQTVVGTDTQVTTSNAYGVNWPGATLISFNALPQVSTTKTTAFIPKSFAGTSFRLIFVWTNGTSAGTVPPAAIDNISLVSRVPEEITSANSGLWSKTTTWDGGKVPTPADVVVIDGTETVMIDSRYSGAEDLILAGTNSLVQFALSSTMDEFSIANDLNIAGGGARFNNHDGTNGKFLKLGHNLDVGAGARFDSNIGGTANFQGRLTLNGSTVQTVTVDPAGFVGGSAAGTNAFGNQPGALNQLEVTNTSTADSNVIWAANGVRIKSNLILTSGRVNIAAGNRLILGNFGSLTGIVCPPGNGFTGGTLSKWQSSSNTKVVQPGTEYPGTDVSFRPSWYPFTSTSGQNRSLYFMPDGNPSVAGEVAITYTDATTVTGSLSINDGGYTITDRYNGNFTFSTPDASATASPIIYAANTTTPNNRIGLYANGAFETLNGSARLIYASTAMPGTHQDGTTQPFVFRKGLSMTDLTAQAMYVGINDGSVVNTATAITSATSGDWDSTSTWVGGAIPSCSSIVTIAAGHNVTVTTTANAAGVVIKKGGTLTNNAGATIMTVGCTNNNAAFYNYGTHTMTAGNLKVNGSVSHKDGSFFNQTGGDIIIDSNNNGAAATSVAFGGSSCKIETSNLALTGGKITIVDPLVNESTPVNVTTASSLNLNTAGATGTFNWNTTGTALINQNTIVMANPNYFSVGQTVTGPGIPAGTTVLTVTPGSIGFTPPTTLVLSNNLSAQINTATALTFSSMHNGSTAVVVEANANNTNISNGSGISGTGIQSGTTIVSINTTTSPESSLVKINLSQPVSGLATSPITAQQAVSLPAITIGGPSVILTAPNPNLVIGMPVSGTGLLPGTFIADINTAGTKVTFSTNVQPGAPTPLVFDAYYFNTQASGSFIYSSPNHYAAGLNHTLQIGDGVSTEKGSVITNGFNCQFQQLGGLFSMGNLTVNAPDGNNRYMYASNLGVNTGGLVNVQNNFTIAAGSVFKKTNGNAVVYVGGNIVNNGSFNMPWGSTSLYLGNFINGVAVPTTQAQTISGSGTFSADQYALTGNYSPEISVSSLTINNTSTGGVTLSVPNFRVATITLTNGILYTSSAFPIYLNYADVMNANLFGGTYPAGSATAYIDGPAIHSNKFDSSTTQYRSFPVGKNGKFLPISIASSGGVELMVEAFDTNSGTVNPAIGSNLSATRWAVTRVGSAGTFTGYNVRMGALPNINVNAYNVIVQSATANGTYDVVATPASAITFTAGTPNTINLTTAQTGGMLGNFAYSDGVACTGTPAPGATLASTTTPCGGQPVILSLTTPTTGAGVTYQWQIDTGSGFEDITGATAATYVATPTQNTSYRCNVICSSSTGTSTPVAVTVSSSVATGDDTIICASGIANLVAEGSSVLNWYDVPTGGTLLFSGATYSPEVVATTTYYVASATASSGSVNTLAYAGTATSTALFKGIAFDVTNRVKLKTVTVYPKNTVAKAPITVALYDATGNVVAGTAPVTFVPTTNTGTVGTVSQVVTLNYNIPAGIGYRLVATNGLASTTNILGNSTAIISYPTAGPISLRGNVSALNDAIATGNNATNCFHNLTFDEICESTTRTPIVVNVGDCPQVNLKLFIEGYYAGGNAMTPVKANQGVGVSTTLVDDVTVELRDANSPHDLVATVSAQLQTNGDVSATLPALAGSYYIAVKHRNALETWSATAQTVGASPLTYDFTTAANKAYGDNMKNIGGVFCFYSGDINQDGFIEGGDFPILINASDDFLEGFQTTDLNGDGFVDGADFPFLINNSDNFVEILRPF
ncbi:dockerin type I domain-containing protein [Flavobacterium buctense]|uniref:Dockerin type I domain-containing protein n=1 Tax=Flavobacterium buctense TaxID=1648146 RepID=A0ABU9E3Y2_9FLAO|nr:dockerin type I domain-containing protein [Flavobacterium buctense]